MFPSSPKAQRDSRLTRLADEKVYRSLAISTDTNWAEIALRSMPIQPARPAQDLSAAIAVSSDWNVWASAWHPAPWPLTLTFGDWPSNPGPGP